MTRPKYFIDTEFLESGPDLPVYLLSIGIVCDDGREYYAQMSTCPFSVASEWVQTNVFPHLSHKALVYGEQCCAQPFGPHCPWKSRQQIAREVYDFCATETHHKPIFWGYYADYDWVVLCQLFGSMLHLPNGWPMYCRDLKQWCDDLGNPQLPEQDKGEHNALVDARWNRTAWEFLQTYAQTAQVNV